MESIRHGDVVIQKTDAPEGVENFRQIEPRERGLILADGEVTGHAHVIPEYEKAALFIANDNSDLLWLEVKDPVKLQHEEHGTASLTAGWYRVSIKRQYSEEHGWSKVVD